jgi:hypothetical protein
VLDRAKPFPAMIVIVAPDAGRLGAMPDASAADAFVKRNSVVAYITQRIGRRMLW